ncbi:M15 family metallopeptidase [Bacillus cereus group sp. Bc015]|uniref:M15 family metallopeptidase n=1 Tax=Bacillus cereus group sp. Bc015 TaxID=3018123 RepID=UPI0022E48B84|nr:M15 family metallopeptidase [Bacillus cereus group sp. Bc015]MDA2738368.1 M15 family metallopeptidase [Bacillus cereus group sp. Bc015]
MKYDSRNRKNLNQLGDHTKALAYKWYQYCLDHGIEILIYETIRTVEKQRENVRKGASQTMKSYHIVGQALDFVPIKSNGLEDWNGYNKEPWASAIRYAKQIGFEWGGDWKGFVDSPHLQYNYKGYGTDTFHGRGQAPSVSTPSTPATPTGNGIGVATVTADVLNVRSAPSTSASIVKKVKHGEAYETFGYKDGFYNVGTNQWISANWVTFVPKGQPKPQPKPQPDYRVGVVTGDVWLHSTPDFNASSRVRVLKKGEAYKVWGEVNGMYSVGGYVSKKYMKLT